MSEANHGGGSFGDSNFGYTRTKLTMSLEIQGGDILGRQLIGWDGSGMSDRIDNTRCKTQYAQVCSEHNPVCTYLGKAQHSHQYTLNLLGRIVV